MYTVDHRDTIRHLDGVPKPEIGAPHPILISNDSDLLLAYFVSPTEAWGDGNLTVHDPRREPIALVTFRRPWIHVFGAPNDETLHGHPLASRGLESYDVFEVGHSSWIRELQLINAVHPHHSPDFFSYLRHFIFAFHDSLLECVADGLEVSVDTDPMETTLQKMLKTLGS